jgi:hypothetical protein
MYWQLQSPRAFSPKWQYLNQRNQWASLGDTVVDGTKGLLGSGLWSATLPEDAADNATQMPGGRYWLRATMAPATSTADISGYPWLQGLATNCMTATLSASENIDAAHFEAPLASSTITRPVTPVSGIETVNQPWPSTGGQPPETVTQFYERVARRLSHRGRALTWQDMASLLKEHYPSVFDVAIPPAGTITRLPAPVEQQLLVIPVNAKKDNQDPLRPMFSPARLDEMTAFLKDLASPWASIDLINPSYRNVSISYDVEFNISPEYGRRKLQELLTLHYMPWVWNHSSGVRPGNTLDYYGIIAWIQGRIFVEKVNDLLLDNNQASIQGLDHEVLVLTWESPTLNAPERKNNG